MAEALLRALASSGYKVGPLIPMAHSSFMDPGISDTQPGGLLAQPAKLMMDPMRISHPLHGFVFTLSILFSVGQLLVEFIMRLIRVFPDELSHVSIEFLELAGG